MTDLHGLSSNNNNASELELCPRFKVFLVFESLATKYELYKIHLRKLRNSFLHNRGTCAVIQLQDSTTTFCKAFYFSAQKSSLFYHFFGEEYMVENKSYFKIKITHLLLLVQYYCLEGRKEPTEEIRPLANWATFFFCLKTSGRLLVINLYNKSETLNEGQYVIHLMKLTKNSKIWQHVFTHQLHQTLGKPAIYSSSWAVIYSS